jgi:cysteine sulfinate desulfinase/cysteine desulfurase-like protein
MRRDEIKAYIKTLCQIYYNKKSTFYRDASIRNLIDKAKQELLA